jgi:general secretion pathway protein J
MWRGRTRPAPARGPRRSRDRGAGFTLIELLVALAIFAVLSGFAYRALDTLLQSRAALERESRKWRDVTVFMGRVERDLAAVLPKRRAHAASGALLAPVSSALDAGTLGNGLALTRSGSPLQENALAAPQRIAYRLHDTQVERLAWAGVDAAPRDEPTAVLVLNDVRALEFRFLDATGEWRGTWGLPGAGEGAPAAVEMRLELASGERLVRLVDLPPVAP